MWFSCFAPPAGCGAAATEAAVNRVCVESRRDVETRCQPAGSLAGGHVLDDVVTERTRAGISQSVSNTALVKMWEIRGRTMASGGYRDMSH